MRFRKEGLLPTWASSLWDPEKRECYLPDASFPWCGKASLWPTYCHLASLFLEMQPHFSVRSGKGTLLPTWSLVSLRSGKASLWPTYSLFSMWSGKASLWPTWSLFSVWSGKASLLFFSSSLESEEQDSDSANIFSMVRAHSRLCHWQWWMNDDGLVLSLAYPGWVKGGGGYFTCSNDFYLPSGRFKEGGGG